ncbi:MAG TPA: hypothetical protein VF406_16305 [Thermodesulfobacteriota bacterium]
MPVDRTVRLRTSFSASYRFTGVWVPEHPERMPQSPAMPHA